MQPGLPLPLPPAMLPLDGHPDLFLTTGSAPPTRAVLGHTTPNLVAGPAQAQGPPQAHSLEASQGGPTARSPGPPSLLSSPDTMWDGPRSTLVRAPRWTFAASSQGEEMEARRSNGRSRSARPQDQGSKLHPCLEPPPWPPSTAPLPRAPSCQQAPPATSPRF